MIATHFWDVIADGGAKGDGTTDDTAAIQGILNDAAAVGGAVYVPSTAAFYLVSGLLTVGTGVRLVIDGTVQMADGANSALLHLTGSGIVIEGKGVLDGNSANNSGPLAGIYTGTVVRAADILIRDITVQNTCAWPVNLVNCDRVRLERVKLINGGAAPEFADGANECWAHGIHIESINDYGFCFYGGCTNCGITDSVIRDGGPCIGVLSDEGQTAGCDGITISNNVFLTDATSGQDRMGMIVANNTGSSTGDHLNLVITGNQWDGSTSYEGSTCVYISSCHDVLFENNRLSYVASEYGLQIDYAQRVRVMGNDIHNVGVGSDPAAGVGILLGSNSSSVIVERNSIYQDSGSGMKAAIFDEGTGNRVQGNWEWGVNLDLSAFRSQRTSVSLPGLAAGAAHSGTFSWPQPFFSTPNVFSSIDVLSTSESYWDCVTAAVYNLTNTGGSYYIHNLGAGSTSGSGELVLLGFAD
jgi:hypothetical protein